MRRLRLILGVGAVLVAVIDPSAQTTTSVTRPSDRVTLLTHTFAATPERVFAAFTEPRHQFSWMSADGLTLRLSEVQLNPGGSLRYVFSRPGGRRLEVRGAITALDPPRLLTYIESYDFSPLRIEVVTEFDDLSDGQTAFRQTLTYASMADRDGDFASVSSSAAEAHARLDRYLASIR